MRRFSELVLSGNLLNFEAKTGTVSTKQASEKTDHSRPSPLPPTKNMTSDMLILLHEAKQGGATEQGKLLSLYSNYLKIIAQTQLDRPNPSACEPL